MTFKEMFYVKKPKDIPTYFLMEAIINPELIKLYSLNLNSLNNIYNPEIEFYSDKILHGEYDHKKDKIYIYLPKNEKLERVEALIAHEAIHREQSKRSGSNMFKIAEKQVLKINALVDKYRETEDLKYFKIYQQELHKFQLDNVFEKMAYSYQLVKERKILKLEKPEDVLGYFKKILKVKIDKKLKKYIGMYWLIKDTL